MWFLKTILAKIESQDAQWFWADQISIDQSNTHERNHQVNLMSQTYSRAMSVWTCIGGRGLPDPELLQQELDKLSRDGTEVNFCHNSRSATLFVDIIDDPYWRRLWVQQEMLLAKKLVIWCRDVTMDRQSCLNLLSSCVVLPDRANR